VLHVHEKRRPAAPFFVMAAASGRRLMAGREPQRGAAGGSRDREVLRTRRPRLRASDLAHQTWRATIIFLISAMALAGFRPFGQTLAQFMIVWQR
jgi:hypothetical protein